MSQLTGEQLRDLALFAFQQHQLETCCQLSRDAAEWVLEEATAETVPRLLELLQVAGRMPKRAVETITRLVQDCDKILEAATSKDTINVIDIIRIQISIQRDLKQETNQLIEKISSKQIKDDQTTALFMYTISQTESSVFSEK